MSNNKYADKKGRYEVRNVTLDTVDGAVYDYFDIKLSPTVDRGDNRPYKVPIFYAGHERFAAMRKNKFRDKHGTLILPVISIRRTDVDRTRGFGGMAQETKSITVSKIIHPKTPGIQNAIEARKNRGVFFTPRRESVIETLTLPFPDFCNIFYEITIWSQHNTQMNEILEKIFYKYEHLDSFVMPSEYEGKHPKGDSYYFVGFREGMVTKRSNDDDFTDQERIVKYMYNIKVPAYLMLDPDDETLSYGEKQDGTKEVFKKQSVNKIKLQERVVSLDTLSAEEYEKLFG